MVIVRVDHRGNRAVIESDSSVKITEDYEDVGMPPVSEQVKGFGLAIMKMIEGGVKPADPETLKKRQGICDGCEFLGRDGDPPHWQGRCKKCGCFMKVKARIAAMTCKIGKW